MFEKMGEAPTRSDIEGIEANLRIAFPEDFVKHYLSYVGGIPAKPFFYSEDEDVETGAQGFLPLKNRCCDIPIDTAEDTYLSIKSN